MTPFTVTIAIPTYNRAYCLPHAIDAALNQSYHDAHVVVIDDGSTDETHEVVRPYLDRDDFCYIRLGQNVGTANAKNVALMLTDFDAITFHDSDDIPDPHKILQQTRALTQESHYASPVLDWASYGFEPEGQIDIDVVVGAHKFIKVDGSVHIIEKRISLLDDFFPHLQFPAKTEGDWILINSGLFRRRVFSILGGYLDSVEEDRELRNRLIGCGFLFFYLEQPLLTKIEMAASLTMDDETGYEGEHRLRDRDEVWRRKQSYLRGDDMESVRAASRVPIDLDDLEIVEISNPALLTINEDFAPTPATVSILRKALANARRQAAEPMKQPAVL